MSESTPPDDLIDRDDLDDLIETYAYSCDTDSSAVWKSRANEVKAALDQLYTALTSLVQERDALVARLRRCESAQLGEVVATCFAAADFIEQMP